MTHQISADELCANRSDGTPRCITDDQLTAMLTVADQADTCQSGEGSSTSGASATPTSDRPPIIQINGDNPVTITTSDSYSYLGATITGPTTKMRRHPLSVAQYS